MEWKERKLAILKRIAEELIALEGSGVLGDGPMADGVIAVGHEAFNAAVQRQPWKVILEKVELLFELYCCGGIAGNRHEKIDRYQSSSPYYDPRYEDACDRAWRLIKLLGTWCSPFDELLVTEAKKELGEEF